MTINEAIVLLDGLIIDWNLEDEFASNCAIKLGVEALKHIKSERTIYGYKRHFPLKGETEEII